MKISTLAYSLMFFSLPAVAAEHQQQISYPEQGVTLGTEKSYSVQDMKERCAIFDKHQQLKPFSIRIECEKTENLWVRSPKAKMLPHWVQYGAAGMGKGRIVAETTQQNKEAQAYECLAYQEKTLFFKGYLELTCDEFMSNAESLVSLCRDGFIGSDGRQQIVNWRQVGEMENGTLYSDGCESKVGQSSPSQDGGVAQGDEVDQGGSVSQDDSVDQETPSQVEQY